MTSEEIIQRLLDEKRITVKEAITILKDLAKIGLQQWIPGKLVEPDPYPNNIVVMYGVTTSPTTYSDNTSTYTANSTDTESIKLSDIN